VSGGRVVRGEAITYGIFPRPPIRVVQLLLELLKLACRVKVGKGERASACRAPHRNEFNWIVEP